jgi:DNA-directed RNA polymerase subunit alpha
MENNIPLAQKVEFKEMEQNKGSFEIQPLYPGYGLTLGNTLRRVLLSSLGGGAIETLKIKGVEHEFSTLEWMKEDIVDVVLNLKQVRIKLSPEVMKQAEETGEPIKLNIELKGAKDVTAKDFKKTAGVEVANPDLKIATLTDAAANLEMEVTVGYGLGYSPTEERKDRDYEIGMMAVDAIYTPIKRVGYDIDNVRVGDMTNWDKLTLNIETDGTIGCEEAFKKAVEILVDQFGALLNPGEAEAVVEEVVEEKEEEVKEEETKEEDKE